MKQFALCLALAVALGMGYGMGKEPAEPIQQFIPSQTVQPGRSDVVETGDTRAEVWQRLEELGIAKPEGVVGGFAVPIFTAYQGGFYGIVAEEEAAGLRFALSEEELFFNSSYTRKVYLVENHPDCIAVHINGMEVYRKIFDVTFDLEGQTYAIAYSPVMNADYGLGDVVLETGDFTVYEAVRLQGAPAETAEYIVDILPMLQRERPNLFDGSDLEPGGDYADQWQLALPVK